MDTVSMLGPFAVPKHGVEDYPELLTNILGAAYESASAMLGDPDFGLFLIAGLDDDDAYLEARIPRVAAEKLKGERLRELLRQFVAEFERGRGQLPAAFALVVPMWDAAAIDAPPVAVHLRYCAAGSYRQFVATYRGDGAGAGELAPWLEALRPEEAARLFEMGSDV